MGTYIALIKGINVGGAHKVPMADLREIVEATGCTDVRTYIQSGNVVFTSSERSAPAVEKALETGIEARFGYAPSVVVRTPKQMAAVVEGNPYLAAGADTSKLHVMFFKQAPSASALDGLDLDQFAPEECTLAGSELFLHYPNGLGRAKLQPSAVEKAAGSPGTVRNWNTVTKLVAMADGSA